MTFLLFNKTGNAKSIVKGTPKRWRLPQVIRLNGSLFAFFNLNSVKIAQKSDENWRFEGKSVNFLGKTLAKIKNMCYNNQDII